MSAPTEAQHRAVAARGNVVVSAGAGTGKTRTLVQRCLAVLEEGCSLENILMVTFTEAAAVEMRGRIREALVEKIRHLRRQNPGSETPSAVGRRRRLAEHFEKQLVLMDTALISTLHSFCFQLAREHFYRLELDPDFTVLDEHQTQPLIGQGLDAVLEAHYGVDAPGSRAVCALVRAQGSEERVRELVLKLHRYSRARDCPEAWLEEQRALFAEPRPEQWRRWWAEAYAAWSREWLPELDGFGQNPAVALCRAALKNAAGLEGIARALRAVGAADEDEKNWPRGSKGAVREPLKDFFNEAKFLESLAPLEGADPLAEDWELARHDMLALIDLTREFTVEFSRAKREAGGVDFADLEQCARRALADAQIADQWRRRLHHVFVDEYQDINAIQDAILRALSREGAQANRFLVGDVKQSIYRFRLAAPAIFRDYEKAWSDGRPLAQRVVLSGNFRSRQAILEFVNPLFQALMRSSVGGVDYESLEFSDPPGRAALAHDGEARVELHLLCEAEESNGNGQSLASGQEDTAPELDLLATEREARLVASRLSELMRQGHEILDKQTGTPRPIRWSDMAVLLRSPAGRAEAFAKEFAALGVPLEAARGGFFDRVEISDLVSLLKLLDNPLQDIPLLAVLRSPLVGMSLDELAEIRAGEAPENRAKFFWLAAEKFHRQKTGSDAWHKLDRFRTRLLRWRELVRRTSLSNALETALAETHYTALLQAGTGGGQPAANVRRLVDLAREYDPSQRQGLLRFLRFVEAQREIEAELAPAQAGRDAVQLTSIHQSKGLEFPLVVVAGLGSKFNFQDLHGTLLLDDVFGLCPKITTPGTQRRYPSLAFWLAERRQSGELLGEELRLLYVAMTRARDTLILVGSLSKGAAEDWRPAGARELRDRELLAARQPLDWLQLWFCQATAPGDWIDERTGANRLLRWKFYSDPCAQSGASGPGPCPAEPAEAAVPSLQDGQGRPDEASLAGLTARLEWKYPFEAATRQKAKMSVTELRRGQDEEAESARFVRRQAFGPARRKPGALNAAERGIAHHRFLERIDLARTSSREALREEAARLMRQNWLSRAEVESLDFAALEQFWHSDFGRKTAAHAAQARRELQFTARMSGPDLAALGLEPPEGLLAEEFVVVQGMVDLAIILPGELWIADFKTDEIGPGEVAARARIYEAQLKLYARALSGIYARRVTDCRLYFLACAQAVTVEI